MYAENAKLNRCKKLLEAPVTVDRNKEPPKCRLCKYYQPDFRYRRCLFSACPYGKDRNKEPPKCRLCPYYQPDFRYRRCLFSSCPYGKDRNTAFRRKPLRSEKI
ncbi:MAG: hypothetical protein IJK38_08585, partial [Oscillospiraceae bacterium]|nr:hypothetical protein [Oscillospiraceae bacterium]